MRLKIDVSSIDTSKFVKREMTGNGLFEMFVQDVVSELGPDFESEISSLVQDTAVMHITLINLL